MYLIRGKLAKPELICSACRKVHGGGVCPREAAAAQWKEILLERADWKAVKAAGDEFYERTRGMGKHAS